MGNPLLQAILVVANQCCLILCKSIFRNFSAFEESVDVAFICKATDRKGEWYNSGLFQSFAEKVRKIRVLKEVNIRASG